MASTRVYSRSTAPKDSDLNGRVARKGKDLVGQAVPVCPAVRDGPKIGQEEGAWAVEAQVEEVNARVEAAPHRGCVERASYVRALPAVDQRDALDDAPAVVHYSLFKDAVSVADEPLALFAAVT